jgi:hypothetical protein
MIMPVSEEKTERTTKLEIEVFQVVVSAEAAESKGYVSDDVWYRDWLARLRLGNFEPDGRAARRIAYYADRSQTERRNAFSNILAQALPEALRAPLILFKLLPLAVEVATAQAFGKSAENGGTSKQKFFRRSPNATNVMAGFWRTAISATCAAIRSGLSSG